MEVSSFSMRAWLASCHSNPLQSLQYCRKEDQKGRIVIKKKKERERERGKEEDDIFPTLLPYHTQRHFARTHHFRTGVKD